MAGISLKNFKKVSNQTRCEVSSMGRTDAQCSSRSREHKVDARERKAEETIQSFFPDAPRSTDRRLFFVPAGQRRRSGGITERDTPETVQHFPRESVRDSSGKNLLRVTRRRKPGNPSAFEPECTWIGAPLFTGRSEANAKPWASRLKFVFAGNKPRDLRVQRRESTTSKALEPRPSET